MLVPKRGNDVTLSYDKDDFILTVNGTRITGVTEFHTHFNTMYVDAVTVTFYIRSFNGRPTP